MSETPAATEQTTEQVVLSAEDAQALARFKAKEIEEEKARKTREKEEAIIAEPNQPLEDCLGECQVARGTESYDKTKDDAAQALFEINQALEDGIRDLNSQDLPADVRNERKMALIEENSKMFDSVVAKTMSAIEEQGKQTESELFSNNLALGALDVAILNNPAFLEQMMKRPYDFMNQKHGESNAQIILALANRGFLSESFTNGKGNIFDGANRRFSNQAYKQMEIVKHNRENLQRISNKQREKYNRLNHKGIVQKVADSMGGM